MKKHTLFFVILALSSRLAARDLSLQDCYAKAVQAHPLQQEWKSRQMVSDLNRKNLNARWLPSLTMNAGATHFSDVASFDQILGILPVPVSTAALPKMPKNQYKATLDVSQTLFDGGMVHASRKAERAALQADLQALQTEFYKVRDQVNQAYFTSLMLQKQSELAEIYKNEVMERRAALESGVRNGVMLPSDVDVLDAEALKIDQQITELRIQQARVKNILGILIGEPVSETMLFLPVIKIPEDTTIRRPEIALFEKQKASLEANENVVRSQQIPKAAAFATCGYGQPPGNDFFNENFDTYYIVGVGLSWNIFNWNTTKRTRQVLQEQQHIVNARKNHFIQQIRIALSSSRADIDRIRVLLESDEKLIGLRNKIKQAAASKLNNGTISSTEFLTEFNAEREARISYEMHKIQWVQAKVNYLTVAGQNNLKSENGL